jgi:hypothetical protein
VDMREVCTPRAWASGAICDKRKRPAFWRRPFSKIDMGIGVA